jgi:cupin
MSYSEEVFRAFAKKGCTVLKGAYREWDSDNRNSIVMGIPPIDLYCLLKNPKLRARKSLSTIQAGASIVNISGPALDVESHYHISHLLGLVTHGQGWLNVPSKKGWLMSKTGERWMQVQLHPDECAESPNIGKTKNEDFALPVTQGDVIVLPRNAYHVFRCATGNKMAYIALEFSDHKTDFQAHH